MSWKRTKLEKPRKTNEANEILLNCIENTSSIDNFWIYNMTAMLNSWRGIERSRLMQNVTHEIVGRNGVTVFIICDSPRMTNNRAKAVAKGFYNGNTLSYRLD